MLEKAFKAFNDFLKFKPGPQQSKSGKKRVPPNKPGSGIVLVE